MVMCRQRTKTRCSRSGTGTVYARTGFGIALCVIACLADAQEELSNPAASVEFGLGRSDNLNRDAEELAANIGRLAVGFSGYADRRWLQAALNADIEYRKYDASELLVDDELLGSVDGVLELHAVPEKFQWDFRYGYGQVRIDAFGAVGPLNRQRTTSLSTGPQVKLPLGERTLLHVAGTLSDQSFEATRELDGRSSAVRMALERQTDPVTQLTVALEGRKLDYDLDSQTQDTASLSLEYRRELASGESFASIGRGRLEVNDGNAEPVTVGRLQWSRSVGARSQIEICAGREITDAGSLFAGASVAVGCPGDADSFASVARTTNNRSQDVISTTNPLVRSGGSVSFEINGERGSLGASFSMAQDRFEEGTSFDNDSTIVEISGSREVAQYWRAELTARLWIQDFIDHGRKNEDRFVRLSITRLLARNMRVTLSFDQNRRVGGVGTFNANDYFLSFGRDFGR